MQTQWVKGETSPRQKSTALLQNSHAYVLSDRNSYQKYLFILQ